MYPPAEDNYGTDACSILCLASVPGVVVIATAEGRLYHCVLLTNSDKQQVSENIPCFFNFFFLELIYFRLFGEKN